MASWSGRAARAAATAAVMATASALCAGTATARAPLVRVGHAASLPLFTSVKQPLRATTHLQLSVALKPRSPAALQRFAQAVSTPGSADYGRYLSVHQFAGRFGATDAAVSAVTRTLRDEGLSVSKVTANDLMLTVSGTARTIDSVMSARLSQVELPDGRHAYANLAAPAFPAAIARDIQGVIGLDNVTPAEPAGLVRGGSRRTSLARTGERRAELSTGGPQPTCSFGTDPNGNPVSNDPTNGQNGYSYDQIAGAYGFSSLYQAGDLGQNETIALVELQPYSTGDIQTFQSCYGTSAPVGQINVGGGPSSDDNCSAGSSTCEDDEAALDIETVIALAPRATVDVYEGPDSGGISEQATVLNQIVADDKAKVISTSTGACEAATPAAAISAENTSLQEAAAQGQSFFSASGDAGSEACSQLGAGSSGFSEDDSVQDPAAQPFATGVGGTEMFNVAGSQAVYDDTGAPRSEVVWNEGTASSCGCGGTQGDSFGGGTGGGVSQRWPMPSYQTSASSALGVIGPDSSGSGACSGSRCREVPDVSADANGSTGYIVYNSSGGPASWNVAGGTSAAAPLWAAYMALVDADSTCRSLTIGFANPALYTIAGNAYAADFYDVQPSSTLASALGVQLQQISNNDTLYQWGVTSSSNTSSLYPVTAGYDMATGLGSMQAPALAASLCSMRSPVYSVSVRSPGAQKDGTALPVSLRVAATDSGSGTTLTYKASGLPAGLSMSSSGLITGTPTTVGTGTVTVTATDQFTNNGSIRFPWKVVRPKSPTAKQTLSATGNGNVRWGMRLTAGAYAPRVASVKVSIPRSLSFTHRAKSLKQGITVKAGSARVAYRASGGGGSVTLTFSKPKPSLTISIAMPAITESKGLEQTLRRGKTKKHKPVTVTVKVMVAVRNALGAPTHLTQSFKL